MCRAPLSLAYCFDITRLLGGAGHAGAGIFCGLVNVCLRVFVCMHVYA